MKKISLFISFLALFYLFFNWLIVFLLLSHKSYFYILEKSLVILWAIHFFFLNYGDID